MSHRLQRHLVHTFDSEQHSQIHSFLPSIEMASAKTFSALSFPGIHEPLRCVCKASLVIPDQKSFESKTGKDHTSTGERQSPGSRQQRKTTNQTPNPVSTNRSELFQTLIHLRAGTCARSTIHSTILVLLQQHRDQRLLHFYPDELTQSTHHLDVAALSFTTENCAEPIS